MKPTPALIRHFRRPFSFLTTSVICATSALSHYASLTLSGAAVSFTLTGSGSQFARLTVTPN